MVTSVNTNCNLGLGQIRTRLNTTASPDPRGWFLNLWRYVLICVSLSSGFGLTVALMGRNSRKSDWVSLHIVCVCVCACMGGEVCVYRHRGRRTEPMLCLLNPCQALGACSFPLTHTHTHTRHTQTIRLSHSSPEPPPISFCAPPLALLDRNIIPVRELQATQEVAALIRGTLGYWQCVTRVHVCRELCGWDVCKHVCVQVCIVIIIIHQPTSG